MKTSTLIFTCIIAVLVAYVLGRYIERLATVQGEVGDLEMRVVKLENDKMRGEVRWEWLYRIASRIPVVRGFLS